MNFIDRLTLLLLTLSAVKSALIPKDTTRAPNDVISLIEVFNKSYCQPREVLVDVQQEYPNELDHIYVPSCVVVKRCAGCCNDEMLQCTPTATSNVTMEIKRLKVQRQENDIYLSFTEHSACECRLKTGVRKKKSNVCEPCCDNCPEKKKRLFVQDPSTCRCTCKHTLGYCKQRHLEINERTCKCGKPRR
ncbi:hypothetical protein ILYODFUR_008221 [Ilyodon furcidens]|uniref:Platelet-derived growth factor (PDGF) family profile domain-containing protein n=1 Tax=Ilyodon furcidens TaxID=33524 RepID=A0ABV0V1B4_9TELE